jgi:protein-arginine kinase activator protein McsA
MQCQRCRDREATVHITRSENDAVHAEHLCPQCAASVQAEITESLIKSARSSLSVAEQEALQKRLANSLSQAEARRKKDDP